MQFTCPTCGVTLALPDDSAGRKAQCPSCQAVFRVSEPSVFPSESPELDRPPSISQGPVTSQDATMKPGRRDAVACPGCDKLLAFNATSAGQVVICPSCQRRIRMPTAAEMNTGPETGTSGRSVSDLFPAPVAYESTSNSGQPSRSASWRSDDPYAAPPQTMLGPNSFPGKVNYATPGAFLLGISALNLVYDLLWSGLFALGAMQEKEFDGDTMLGFAMFFGWALVAIACHSMSFVAGLKMTRRQSLSTARLGAILGFVPCGFCFLFQVPFAIWAVIVLFSAEAPTDFES